MQKLINYMSLYMQTTEACETSPLHPFKLLQMLCPGWLNTLGGKPQIAIIDSREKVYHPSLSTGQFVTAQS